MNWRRIVLGVSCACLGAGVVLAALGVRSAASSLFGEAETNTVSASCAGAELEVTVAPGPGRSDHLRTVSVAVFDDDFRDWEVEWPGWERPRAAVPVTPGEPVGAAFAVLGDSDDGDDRDVWVRPVGAADWCRVHGELG